MDLVDLRNYCLSKSLAEEDFPFGPETLVFKVGGRMFALASLDTDHLTVNLKCDPERAAQLRASFVSIQPGYHMNKTHWNTVDFEGGLAPAMLRELIDHSYDLVCASLPKKLRPDGL
ncbi:MAG: MmcQ/YjbR family DNA-binding protein [Saprospiraceae bacterium]|nr:MmcQ/YjbR family DNA-binding protein [Saprospiraceae bacterium]